MAYRGSYFVKKTNTVIRFAVLWSFLLVWCFCHCLFLIGNLVMVESPRFPKSSGIDPKKGLQYFELFIGALKIALGKRLPGTTL